MKVKFSKNVKFVPAFNGNNAMPEGDQLQYDLMPMELSDFYDVLDKLTLLKGATQPDGSLKVDPTSLNASSQKEFMAVCQGFLPKYVKSIGAPLTDANDNEITIEDIAMFAPLISLLSEFTSKLLEISTPTEIELGN